METYLTGQELIDKYKIKQFELINFIKQGLVPHNGETGKPITVVLPDQLELWTCEQLLNIVSNESLNMDEKFSPRESIFICI